VSKSIAAASLLLGILIVCIASSSCLAQENDTIPDTPRNQDTSEPFKSPKLNPALRFNEDWSGLAGQDTSKTGDIFDPIKFVPLNSDKSIWASFGGQLRYRFESFENFGFIPANDDEYSLLRARFHTDLHVGEQVRIFVEIKSAIANSRDLPGGRRALDVDSIDLQNAFVDWVLPTGDDVDLTLRAGRQELLFGKQRLISPLDWANTRRTWDGVSAIAKIDQWTITPFYTQYAPVQKYDFNSADAQTVFYGIYADGQFPDTPFKLDLYFLGLDLDDPQAYNGTTGSEERYTLGARIHGKIADTAWDYDVEAAYQFGEVGSADVQAYMLGSEVGFKLAEAPTPARLFVGLDVASGDDSAGGDVETFNQLFPLGHAYLGFIDAIGRQNIIDVSLGISVSPIEKLTVILAGHQFWRHDTSDAVYNASGGVLRAGGLSNEREVGTEIDLLIKYAFDSHLMLIGGYSHFFAGDFIDEATPAASDDIDFFYFSAQYTF
jgi:hypothetical protein